MIVCSNCGTAMEDDLRFCTECGAPARQAEQTQSTGASSNQQTVPLAQGLPQTVAWASPSQPAQFSPQPTQAATATHTPGLMFAVIAAVALLALLVGGGAVWLLKSSGGSPNSNGPKPSPLPTQSQSPVGDQLPRPTSKYDSAESMIVSGQQISMSGLLGMSNAELRRLRNAVYARHGRLFDTPELQRYFDSRPWYTRRFDYSDRELSSVDKTNVNLIMLAEKEAK